MKADLTRSIYIEQLRALTQSKIIVRQPYILHSSAIRTRYEHHVYFDAIRCRGNANVTTGFKATATFAGFLTPGGTEQMLC